MLTREEKNVLSSLIKKHIEEIKEDESKIIQFDSPVFLSGEVKYRQFLNNLLKKLK